MMGGIIFCCTSNDSRSTHNLDTDVNQGFNLLSAMFLYGSVIVAIFTASISITYCIKLKFKICNGQTDQDKPPEVLDDLWVANNRGEQVVELETFNPIHSNILLSPKSDMTTTTTSNPYCDLVEPDHRNPYESLRNCNISCST